MAKQSVIKRKKNPSILIPLILALMVTFLFYQGAQKKVVAEIMPTQVPIAKTTLAQHTLIKEEDIAMVTIPIKGVPPNVITDPKEIIGKYVATQYTIPKNGYFFKEAVSELDDIPTKVSLQLAPGQVGVPLQINLEKSVANSLEVGQYVQVRFFTSKTPSNQPFEGVLFERMKILALRNSSGTDVVIMDANTDESNKTVNKNQVPTFLVFEATEEQASYLIRAQNLGTLNLVALPKDDGDKDSGTAANTDYEGIKEILNTVKDKLPPEQFTILQTALSEKTTAEGHPYPKNAAQILIDSMSYTIKQLFEENGVLVTTTGEIVFYDEETGQIRYFKDRSEYEGSIYALSKLTPEEIEKLKQEGKLTEAQLQALKRQEGSADEPKYYQTPNGEVFQVIDGKVVFYSNAEVIQTLSALKEKNGRLSEENQALLDKLIQTRNTAPETGKETSNSSSGTDSSAVDDKQNAKQ